MAPLVKMAERDNVRIHVLPFSADASADINGPFVIAKFNGDEATYLDKAITEVAYLDNAIFGAVIEGKEEIAELHRLWEIYRSDALNKIESVQLIMRVAEEWKT